MISTVIIIIAVFSAIAITGALILKFTKDKPVSAAKKVSPKNRSLLVKNATQKLKQNPNDIQTLSGLGNIYYEEHNWEKAMDVYKTLSKLASSNPGKIDKFECNLRYGISALKANKHEDAINGLTAARKLKPSNSAVNYNLGLILFEQKNYEQAISVLRIAVQENPDNAQAQKYLGLALQKSNHFRDALTAIRKALDTYPDDKDLLFALGESFRETGRTDSALKVFLRLRTDPVFGPHASLHSGIIHAQMSMNTNAAEDFEIGIKHKNVPENIFLETRYHYAILLIKMQQPGRAIALLKEIQQVKPGYKDISQLIDSYQELNDNINLQAYMLAGQSDFIMLCRKIVSHFYANASVKITEVTTSADFADIITEIDTGKWEDTVIFRFFRSQGTVGELALRDLHGKIKDLKAGRAICFCAGMFSEESKRFTEGRPIDLYSRDALKRVLDRTNS